MVYLNPHGIPLGSRWAKRTGQNIQQLKAREKQNAIVQSNHAGLELADEVPQAAGTITARNVSRIGQAPPSTSHSEYGGDTLIGIWSR